MTITPFLNNIISFIVNPLIYLAFGVATAYVFYGFVKFLSKQPGDKERDEARKAIIWGILGMVIMFSVYGLIRLVADTYGIRSSDIGSPSARIYLGL